jgi:SOS response associated peptidase (SRAP)
VKSTRDLAGRKSLLTTPPYSSRYPIWHNLSPCAVVTDCRGSKSLRSTSAAILGMTTGNRVTTSPLPSLSRSSASIRRNQFVKFRPADGFFEWARKGSSKQPYCFELNEGELFAFAGLWDGWKNTEGQWIKTCSILTTTPNAVTSAIHDRMPVILDRESYDLWLDPGMTNVQVVSELLKPYDARLMRCYAVSSRVNHVTNDDEECSRPVEVAESQPRLFR